MLRERNDVILVIDVAHENEKGTLFEKIVRDVYEGEGIWRVLREWAGGGIFTKESFFGLGRVCLEEVYIEVRRERREFRLILMFRLWKFF